MPTRTNRAEPVPGPKTNSAPRPAGAVGSRGPGLAGREGSLRQLSGAYLTQHTENMRTFARRVKELTSITRKAPVCG